MAKAVIGSLLHEQASTGTVSCSTNPTNAGLPDSYHPYHEMYNNAKINLSAFSSVPDKKKFKKNLFSATTPQSLTMRFP